MSNVEKVDGRTVRGERNRQALLDATHDLVIEGNLTPSAQEIAQRANVGLRGIFRHFGDMEGLFTALDDQMREQNAADFVGGSREGSFRQRLLHAVEQHSIGYERNRNILLSVQISRWQSEVLRKSYERDNRRLRKDLEIWLPELKTLPTHRREAVDAAASFEMWHRLREHQRKSVEASIDIIYDMIKVLMTAP